MGGLPWWLLQNDHVKLRTRDASFIAHSSAWLREVGRVLAPLQISKGGPILMVQVENEYGFFGSDVEYIHRLRQAILDAGFDVPLFQCNPVSTLSRGRDASLFQVVNFGKDPESAFKMLREVQPKGPLMCGEFYPGWFDTWGYPHHRGDVEGYLRTLEYMLSHNNSFSIYMAHGGTSFGLWGGADIPFKPDTSSYDYDAPIGEAGEVGEKFNRTRALMKRYLLPGETMPDPPKKSAVTRIPAFKLTERALLYSNLPEPVSDVIPKTMEHYGQGQGCILYRTTLPAGSEATLSLRALHDFGWVSINGRQIGLLDRRNRRFSVLIPKREKPSQLDILVEAMGRVNFSQEIADRKGIHAPVCLVEGARASELTNWQIYRLPLDEQMLKTLNWQTLTSATETNETTAPASVNHSISEGLTGSSAPAFWRGTFSVQDTADTFMDLSNWGKGVLWVNGHCLARFWNIGPTQTAFLPGAWLKSGANEVVVFDLEGPKQSVIEGLNKPILDQLRPELDFSNHNKNGGVLHLTRANLVLTARFHDDTRAQYATFAKPVRGWQLCLETLTSFRHDQTAGIAELDLLRSNGEPIPHGEWSILYVDSEERTREDGSAANAINGQISDFWHTEWSGKRAPHQPHFLVIDLGSQQEVAALKYTPISGKNSSRIESFRVYVGNKLVSSQ
jgi:beta-galactosidase